MLTVTGPSNHFGSIGHGQGGSAFSFIVKATGGPAPEHAGRVRCAPQGLTWVDNGNGTATLAGTPGVDQGGVYRLTFTAANARDATQSFMLTVNQAPAITSALGDGDPREAFTFTFTSAGYPAPSVSQRAACRGDLDQAVTGRRPCRDPDTAGPTP